VQTAGRVVGATTELPAGVQLGEDDLDAGQSRPGLDVDRDAPGLVMHRDAAVAGEGDLDLTAEPAEGLVDGIVDDLPQAVHQAAGVGRADVHRWAFAYGLQALEDEEMAGLVVSTLPARLVRWGRLGVGHGARVPSSPLGTESLHKSHGPEMRKRNIRAWLDVHWVYWFDRVNGLPDGV